MDPAVRNLITALHQAPFQYVLALTGGGTGAAGWLLSIPGGSRTILEVQTPYSEQALNAYLGHAPASYCSESTSRDMALRALERARWLSPGAPVVGVGCTASLRSDRPKRGDHRFHLALDSGSRITTISLTLTKEARTREEEETLLDQVLLNALADILGIADRLTIPLLSGEEIQEEAQTPGDALTTFLAGGRAAVCVQPDGQVQAEVPTPRLVLPGSFNPLHDGHCWLAAVAARLLGEPAAFELTVENADKPPLADEEVGRRLAQFTWRGPLWLTRAPTFADKAQLFPGATFIVGIDTAERIVAPRFYQDSAARMTEALEAIRSWGCRFLVAGRLDRSGVFASLEGLALPAGQGDLFTGIPESAFRVDCSSTQLRSRS
jgi:hypothetical protein